MPMPTDYSGDPVPPKQYYLCPHCKEQSPLTKEWVGLTDDELLHIGVATGLERVAAQMIANKLKEKNT
jgi:hypothetical protein